MSKYDMERLFGVDGVSDDNSAERRQRLMKIFSMNSMRRQESSHKKHEAGSRPQKSRSTFNVAWNLVNPPKRLAPAEAMARYKSTFLGHLVHSRSRSDLTRTI